LISSVSFIGSFFDGKERTKEIHPATLILLRQDFPRALVFRSGVKKSLRFE
jgi:hypothetical protein